LLLAPSPSFSNVRLLCSPPTATTAISTLSLHDALPISVGASAEVFHAVRRRAVRPSVVMARFWLVAGSKLISSPVVKMVRLPPPDRKSTRLNSSHVSISYAVFCLKKKSVRKKIGEADRD